MIPHWLEGADTSEEALQGGCGRDTCVCVVHGLVQSWIVHKCHGAPSQNCWFALMFCLMFSFCWAPGVGSSRVLWLWKSVCLLVILFSPGPALGLDNLTE